MSVRRFHRISQVLRRRQPDLTVVMESIQKPHNFAAIVRTCDAVGILEAHVVTERTSIKVRQKAASGTSRWVKIRTHRSVGEAYGVLQGAGFQVLAAHVGRDAVDFREVDYTCPTAVVFGAELEGISDEALRSADGRIAVPMVGMVQSLNVSVAVAIILYEAYRQREAGGGYERDGLGEARREHLLFEWRYPRIADFCRRRGIPYPKMNERGEIVERLRDHHIRKDPPDPLIIK